MISSFRRDLNILYIFWVFPRRQYVMCRRFGTMYQFHLQRLEVDCVYSLLPAFEDGTDTWFRNVGISHIDAREIPKRTYTINSFDFTMYKKRYSGGGKNFLRQGT